MFLYLTFFVYEWVEQQKAKDEMYHEMKEWAFGFVVGMIAWYAISMRFAL
ncbi:MAG: hypothetical protein ACE5KG_05820 [Nitrososphaerales archaeon]